MSKQVDSEKNSQTEEFLSTTILEQLLTSLSVVEDPRMARGIRHSLVNILTIAVLGCLCGCNDAEALEDWGKKEASWLANFLTMPHGTPSQDVFLRLFSAINPTTFQAAFHEWICAVFRQIGLECQIAIDGQTHRRSGDRRKKQKPLHMVHALVCETGLVIGQMATEEKSNEITAIPALLELFDFQGSLISIDAMGTQTGIASKIINGGGDYILAVKKNQKTLYNEVVEATKDALDTRKRTIDEVAPATVISETEVDGGHGRIETRTAHVLTDFEQWVPSSTKWKDAASLVAIEARREELITGKVQEETRYYIASRQLTAPEANKAVRSHWFVENRLHWCLDMTFGQDACRIRTGYASENFAIVRHFALNIIRNYKGDRYSVPRRRRLCDFRQGYRNKVLMAVSEG